MTWPGANWITGTRAETHIGVVVSENLDGLYMRVENANAGRKRKYW